MTPAPHGTDGQSQQQRDGTRPEANVAQLDGIALLNASGEYTHVNQAHATLYGYDDPAVLVGETWQICYSADEFSTIEETVLPVLETEGEWRGELTGKRRDGSTFPQAVTLSTQADGSMVCVVRDITERKAREQAVERDMDLFEQAQRMAHVGGWELNLVDDELRWTDEVRRIHEVPLDYEPTLEQALDYYHPDDAPYLENAIKQAIEDGKPYDLELRLITANDNHRWVRAQGEARQAAGETIRLRGTFQDTTEQKAREQERQTTSNLLSTLMSNIPAGVLIEDSTRNILFTNQAFTELFGIDAAPDDLVGGDCAAAAENVKQLFVDPDRFITETNEAVAEHASVWREAIELVDGRTFERSGMPVQLDDEKTGYLWAYHDITDQKRAENRFQALFENMPDPAVIVELTEGDAITREVNAAFEDIFGYPAESAVDTSLNDLIVPQAFEDESEEIDQKARSGDQLITEVRRQTANGELRDFLFRNVLIENAEGEPRAHGIYTDITERKQRERRLNALHEATRDLMRAETRQAVAEIASRAAGDILDLPLNGVHLYDEDANGLVPLAASPATREVVGDPPTFRPGDGIAWQVFESGEPQLYGDVRSAPTVHNPETPIRSELFLPLGDHGMFLIGSTVVDDFDETDVSLAKVLAANVAIALDRVEHEQALQRQNDRLDAFAGVISHDLRNPLNVAMGNLDLARETGNAEHFEAMARAQTRMERIIQDVLTLVREGESVGETQPIAVDTAARRAWNNVETGTASLQLETDRTIEADTSRLGQLFENLFRNAIEHGGTGVTVRVGWDEDPAGFYIEDTGPGIPPDERSRVFESGFTTNTEGTGFGLAIVEKIAAAHGWEITITDGTDGGARFEVTTEPGNR